MGTNLRSSFQLKRQVTLRNPRIFIGCIAAIGFTHAVLAADLEAGKLPVVGADGFFVPDQLSFYTAMARDTGWGSAIPDMLRNENWNYAVFTLAKQARPGVNQAECLACYKPLDKTSYVFTIEQITAAAKAY